MHTCARTSARGAAGCLAVARGREPARSAGGLVAILHGGHIAWWPYRMAVTLHGDQIAWMAKLHGGHIARWPYCTVATLHMHADECAGIAECLVVGDGRDPARSAILVIYLIVSADSYN